MTTINVNLTDPCTVELTAADRARLAEVARLGAELSDARVRLAIGPSSRGRARRKQHRRDFQAVRRATRRYERAVSIAVNGPLRDAVGGGE